MLQEALPSAAGPARTFIQSLLDESKPMSRDMATAIDREALFHRFHHVLAEYFEKGNRSPAVVTPPGFQPLVDAMPSWIENTLISGSVHDEDYFVFGSFQDPESTILDIGAHFGYSAASIWSAGSAAAIISFEVNPVFEPCFPCIVLLRPGRYDYWLGGVSDSSSSLIFAMPTINGHGIGALTTACTSPGIDGIATDLTDFFEKYLAGSWLDSFRIHTFQSPVAGLTICSPIIIFPFPPAISSPSRLTPKASKLRFSLAQTHFSQRKSHSSSRKRATATPSFVGNSYRSAICTRNASAANLKSSRLRSIPSTASFSIPLFLRSIAVSAF